MTDYPETRYSQVTVYDGMDLFAVTAAAWQQAEATVAGDERVVDVTVMQGSPLHGGCGDERSYTIEYVVQRRLWQHQGAVNGVTSRTPASSRACLTNRAARG